MSTLPVADPTKVRSKYSDLPYGAAIHVAATSKPNCAFAELLICARTPDALPENDRIAVAFPTNFCAKSTASPAGGVYAAPVT